MVNWFSNLYGGGGETKKPNAPEIGLCPCPSCEASGRVYNNLDESSNQWLPCDFCAATGLVTFQKYASYFDMIQGGAS